MAYPNTLGHPTSVIQSNQNFATEDQSGQTLYDLLLIIDPLNANLLYGLCKGIFYSLFLIYFY